MLKNATKRVDQETQLNILRRFERRKNFIILY